MKTFSLVRTVLTKARSERYDLRNLGPVDVVSTEGGLGVSEFEARVDAMRVWCRSIERLLCDRRPAELRVHAGFEKLSRLKKVEARYRRLGMIASSVHVYGEPDVVVNLPGVVPVELSSGPLANEWFLVVRGRGFGAVIAAEDLDGFGGGVKLADRRFRGFASHHPVLVSTAMAAMDEFAKANAQYTPGTMRQRTFAQ